MKRRLRFVTALCLLALMTTVLPFQGVVAQAAAADTDTHWAVRFVLNGGTMYGTTDDHVELVAKVPVNSRLERLPESPRREGYVFGGWFNEPELLTRFQWRPTMAAGNNNFNRINEDKTLYAAWAQKEETVNWELKYHQDFDEPFQEPDEWVLDDHSFQDDPIRAQDGIGYHEREIRRLTPANAEGGATAPSWYTGNLNQYGGGGNTTNWDFYTDLASFTEWRKSHTYGEDNWLTIQQYGRGRPGASGPGDEFGGTGGRFEARNGNAVILTESLYDAATITNTDPLPPYYRLEATVHNIEAGGRAIDPETGREPPISSAITAADWVTPAIPSLGRKAGYNGYQGITALASNTSDADFRSAGPWSVGLNAPNNAVAENGMYFLGILEYPNVRPNNNKHIHWHRKVVFDSDNNRATKSAGTGNAGWSYVWNVDRFQGDGSRYVTMIWCGPDVRNVYNMNYSTWATWVGNMSSLYYTYTQVGTQYNAVYMTDKYLPGESYTFVVERTPEYYMLSMTGNFYHAGEFTYEWTKFHFGYNDPTDPRFNYGEWTWHFNQTPEELRGLTPPVHPDMAAGEGTVYFRDKDGVQHEDKMWPVDSGYPDSIIMGIPHINYYDAYAEFSDIKLYVSTDYLYELDVSAGPGGRIDGTPAGDYNAVTEISLSAVPEPGYEFAGWTFVEVNKGLNLDALSAQLDFTMPTGNVQMVANFTVPVISLNTEANLVKKGDYFTLNPAFNNPVLSNTGVLEFTYNKELFLYRGYSPAVGVTVLNTEETAQGIRFTVMVMDYATKNYGDFLFSAREDVDLKNEEHEIGLSVQYVLKLADNVKEIWTATASTVFTSWNGKNPFNDGEFTLITLSNVIDLFGSKVGDDGWKELTQFFDFNKNGVIDISDICVVAKLIEL